MRTILAFGMALGLAACASSPAPRDYPNRRPQPPPAAGPVPERSIAQPPRAWCEGDGAGPVRQRMLDLAVQEWAAFGFPVVPNTGGGAPRPSDLASGLPPAPINPFTEADRRSDPLIAKYWSAANADVIGRQNGLWRENPSAGWSAPWSAAFLSWVGCAAGLPRDLAGPSPRHFDRVQQSVRMAERDHRPEAAHYIFTRADEVTPLPGDLICLDREEDRPDKATPLGPERFGAFTQGLRLHCDLVVKLEAQRVYAIGGNVTDAVRLMELPLVNGRLVYESQRRWFAVLQLVGGGDADVSRTPTVRPVPVG
jgi:hypothetical protein